MDAAEIEAAIGQRYAEVADAWPGVAVSLGAFVAYVRPRVEERCATAAALDGIDLAGLLLAAACLQGDTAAVAQLDAIVRQSGGRSVRRVDPQDEFADEVLQRLRTRLLVGEGSRGPRLADFRGTGSLAGWVSVAAVRIALNLVRTRKRVAAVPEHGWSIALSSPDVDPELEQIKQRYRQQFGEALRTACGSLPARDRAVLRLYFAEGLNIDAIGKMYDVHRSTVARWIGKTRDALFASTRTILARDMGVPTGELSLMDRMIRSQLDISLDGLLSPPA